MIKLKKCNHKVNQANQVKNKEKVKAKGEDLETVKVMKKEIMKVVDLQVTLINLQVKNLNLNQVLILVRVKNKKTKKGKTMIKMTLVKVIKIKFTGETWKWMMKMVKETGNRVKATAKAKEWAISKEKKLRKEQKKSLRKLLKTVELIRA